MKKTLTIIAILFSSYCIGQDSATVKYKGQDYTVVRFDDSTVQVLRGSREKRDQGFMWVYNSKYRAKKNIADSATVADILQKENDKKQFKNRNLQ